jgi:translation initiation factor 3 subunit A
MFRTCALSLAAIAAIGFSLAMSSSANAFFGGSNGGSGGSHGGSFGGLFHHHHGSSGGSHGDSSSCDCNCGNSGEASEGNHEDNDEHHAVSDRDDRAMEAPSRDVHRDSNGVIVEERNRDGRRHDDRNADHKRDGDKKHDKDVKKDEHKDKDKEKDKDNDKKDAAKK